jgi:threonine/homoserine/homoserine lactone efflux protein
MPIPDLILALAVLLLSPGPTNTLMALAGAERGALRAIPLIAAELTAYLCVVLPLATAGTGLIAAAPGLRPLVTALAAAWVLWLALRMWQIPPAGQDGAATVTRHRIFVTTLLNPKALIIGLVLLPGTPLAPRAAIFAALVVCAAVAWICLGSILARRGTGQAPGLSPLIRRGAAVWLALLSATLAFRAAFA